MVEKVGSVFFGHQGGIGGHALDAVRLTEFLDG